MIICQCEGLSDTDLRQAVREGATSRFELSNRTGAGRCCGSCRCDLKEIVSDELATADAMVTGSDVMTVLSK